jgi:4-hydroxy-tetrahydrodipicolinate synthase
MKRLEGVFVAVATPFREDGSLDRPTLDRLLDALIAQGVHGLVPCGTTGESPTLSALEKRAVIGAAVRAAAGRPVIAGVGGNHTRAVIEATAEAADLGATAALAVTPYYNKPTPEGLLRHFTAVADEGKLPLVLYNVPGRTGVNLAPELAAKLLAHPRIVGIKEASGQYGQWLAIAHGADLADRALLAGDDDAFAPILALGGSGIISASANVAPGHFVALFEAFRKGDFNAMFAIQKKLYPLVKAMFAESNPGPVKYALSRLGFGEDVLRPPLVPVRPETRALVDGALKGLELVK